MIAMPLPRAAIGSVAPSESGLSNGRSLKGRYEDVSARRQERAATMAHATPKPMSDRTGACVPMAPVVPYLPVKRVAD